MMDRYDMSGWGWVGMTVTAVVAVAIVGLIVWAIARRPDGTQGRASKAREQLDMRLACGEIGAEEYRERLDDLRTHSG
jgi:uncharacterized membrane protein